jgi:2-polyprenyl-3-methyl-5-hydroxy-6-metoxy-1,4-benzoquinol methylase
MNLESAEFPNSSTFNCNEFEAQRISAVPKTRLTMAMASKQNTIVHPGDKPYSISNAQERFDYWWHYANSQKLQEPEYLLPKAYLKTEIRPFSYETTVKVEKADEQLEREVQSLGPWAYQMEFKGSNVSTLGRRDDREWKYHRYRGSLLVRNIQALLGAGFDGFSILDVACHCGPFALEFAYLGAARVVGIDLRPENVRQAQWLASTYKINNAAFSQDNVRNLNRYRGFDIAFCAGLFYHLTFPIEFIQSLRDCCEDFVIFDSATHKEPLSAFHVIVNKDPDYSAEGESNYELHPTYRAVIDCLLSVGFEDVIELIGSDGKDVWGYSEGITRSFLAFKKGSKSLQSIRAKLDIC